MTRYLFPFLLALPFSQLLAQKTSFEDRLKNYETKMEDVSFLIGDWADHSFTYDPKSETWVDFQAKKGGKTVVRNTKITTLERVRGQAWSIAGKLNLEGFLSYDVWQGTYRLVLVNDYLGLIDVYEGDFEGNKLVLSNRGPGTYYTRNEKKMFVRMDFEKTEKGWSLSLLSSSEKEPTWRAGFKANFFPKGAEPTN